MSYMQGFTPPPTWDTWKDPSSGNSPFADPDNPGERVAVVNGQSVPTGLEKQIAEHPLNYSIDAMRDQFGADMGGQLAREQASLDAFLARDSMSEAMGRRGVARANQGMLQARSGGGKGPTLAGYNQMGQRAGGAINEAGMGRSQEALQNKDLMYQQARRPLEAMELWQDTLSRRYGGYVQDALNREQDRMRQAQEDRTRRMREDAAVYAGVGSGLVQGADMLSNVDFGGSEGGGSGGSSGGGWQNPYANYDNSAGVPYDPYGAWSDERLKNFISGQPWGDKVIQAYEKSGGKEAETKPSDKAVTTSVEQFDAKPLTDRQMGDKSLTSSVGSPSFQLDSEVQALLNGGTLNQQQAFRMQAKKLEQSGQWEEAERFHQLSDSFIQGIGGQDAFWGDRVRAREQRGQLAQRGLQPVIGADGQVVGYTGLREGGLGVSFSDTPSTRPTMQMNERQKLQQRLEGMDLKSLPKVQDPIQSSQSFDKLLSKQARATPEGMFEFKPEAQKVLGAPSGLIYGTPAQEVEKGPLGPSVVRTDPASGAKYLDGKMGIGAAMAMSAKAVRDTDELKKFLATNFGGNVA